MYLTTRLTTYKTYNEDEKEHPIRKHIKSMPEFFEIDNIGTIEVGFEAGYWRKANQIHKWFVENVQEGEDDCKEYYVSREKLKELLGKVNRILDRVKLKTNGKRKVNVIEKGEIVEKKVDKKEIDNKALCKEILPIEEGFFFGGTEYNDWYYKDLERTKEIIERCLNMPEEWEFFYQSSW